MIDFQFLTLTISLTFVLTIDVTNGENKFSEGSLQTTETDIRAHQMEDSLLDVAETRAQFSVVSADHDLSTAAGGKYFQYARVPHKKSWEFGYKRGNPHHHREQHEQGHGHKFKTKLKWADGKGGHGEHYWDYNHGPGHGHGGGGGGGGHGHGGGGRG